MVSPFLLTLTSCIIKRRVINLLPSHTKNLAITPYSHKLVPQERSKVTLLTLKEIRQMTITLRRYLILVQGYTFSPLRLSLATRNLKESAEIEFNGTH